MKISQILGITIVAGILFELPSCGRTNSSASDMLFEQTDSIAWTVLGGDDIIPFANDMLVTDSSIYVLGLANGKWLHIYNQEGKLSTSKLSQGKSSEEAVNAIDMNIESDTLLSVYDHDISAVKILNTDTWEIDNSINLHNSLPVVWQASTIGKDLVLVNHPSIKGEEDMVRGFSIVDAKSDKVISTYDSIPDVFKDNPMMLMAQENLSVAPDGVHFVSVTGLGGTIETFEVKDGNIHPLYSSVVFPLDFVDVNGMKQIVPDPILGFFSVCAADDYWLASYAGTKNDKDLTKIGIWDWKGKPIRGIKTDKLIMKLAISPDGRQLYGLLMEDDGSFSFGTINLDK